MGGCVSQWITLGGTIFKHPGMNKTVPNTTGLASWSLLYCSMQVPEGSWMPAITPSNNYSLFSGHLSSKRFNVGKTTDCCPKQQEKRVPLPTATCHLEPLSSRSAELASVSITIGKKHQFVFPADLNSYHNQIKPLITSQTIHPLPGSPGAELYTRTNRQFL